MTTDYSGLVTTLWNHAAGYELKIDDYTPRKLREAADAIEQLQAEHNSQCIVVGDGLRVGKHMIESLLADRDERDALRVKYKAQKSISLLAQASEKELQARCERYEKALSTIASNTDQIGIEEIAREALAEDKT